MGSFYATCSITRHTIIDEQEMYIQFMLPNRFLKGDVSIGHVFKESFLNAVKERGLDEAIKSFDESTSTWGKDRELSSKGMIVSDGAYAEWIPFGPAIKGRYNDYGNMVPLDDEDVQIRVKILEKIMGGLPFDTIMSVAQDDRWYTLGLGKYADTDDGHWRPEGINKDMPDWLLHLCKSLSLTYFHAPVYEELSQFNFSADEKNGVIKSKYEIQWKNEYLDPIKEGLPNVLESLKETEESENAPVEDRIEIMEKLWANRELLNSIGIFRYMNHETSIIYQACMARENVALDWFYESLMFMYSLGHMCLQLRQSDYGSQSPNWRGWRRIYDALNPEINKTHDEYYDFVEDDEDEE